MRKNEYTHTMVRVPDPVLKEVQHIIRTFRNGIKRAQMAESLEKKRLLKMELAEKKAREAKLIEIKIRQLKGE